MNSTGSLADSALSPSPQVESAFVPEPCSQCSCSSCACPVSARAQRHMELFGFLLEGICQGSKNAWQMCHKSTLKKSLVVLLLIFSTLLTEFNRDKRKCSVILSELLF